MEKRKVEVSRGNELLGSISVKVLTKPVDGIYGLLRDVDKPWHAPYPIKMEGRVLVANIA